MSRNFQGWNEWFLVEFKFFQIKKRLDGFVMWRIENGKVRIRQVAPNRIVRNLLNNIK
jgi:hypothetical protein